MKFTKTTIMLLACIVAAVGISAACLLPAAKAPVPAAEAPQSETPVETQETPEAPDVQAEVGEAPVNTALLSAAIGTAEKFAAKDYTAESFGALSKSLEAARTVLADKDAAQEKIDGARDALLSAVGGLAAVKVSAGTGVGAEASVGEEAEAGASAAVPSNAPKVTIAIDADTLGRGAILSARTVAFNEGESVLDVLLRECQANGIHMEYATSPVYNSAYVEGIANIYEFDGGELSGWMYSVNGRFPNYGCSRYTLKDGDSIRWRYTCNLGADIGGGGAVQG